MFKSRRNFKNINRLKSLHKTPRKGNRYKLKKNHACHLTGGAKCSENYSKHYSVIYESL